MHRIPLRWIDDEPPAELPTGATLGVPPQREFLRDEGFARVHLEPPEVFRAADEAPTLSTNDAAQFSLAAIAKLALVGDDLGQQVGTTQGADPRGDRRPEKGAAGQRE